MSSTQGIDCRTARRLLNQGVVPGTVGQDQASLGFHVAGCVACRAYRQNPQAQVLAELLATPPPEQVSLLADLLAAPLDTKPAPLHRPRSRPKRHSLVLALLAALVIGALTFVLAPTALALITIQQNLQAMQLATPVPLPPTAVFVLPDLPAATSVPTKPPGTFVPLAPLASPTPPPNLMSPTDAPQLSPDQLTPILLPPQPTPSPASPPGRPPGGWRPLPTLMPTVPIPPSTGEAITVLLMGIDRRPDETYPSRTDAIAVARIDPQQRRIALLSLPRDLVVPIPGFGMDRINAASVYGDLNPQTGGGIALTRRTVSNLLGVPIDYVVQVDFNGFIGVVDSIGGVTVDVERELYDPQYPTMDYGYTVAHFLPGPQYMDGATALMYGRVRHMDSDWDRMKRQQTILVAILQRLREQNPLEQIQSMAAMTTALRGYVFTDLPQETIVSTAWAFRNFAPDSVERYVLDGSMVTQQAIPGDPYAQLPLPGMLDQLTRKLMRGP